ncbi:MAG: autotransporter outer membrane beta-barrel domain-containing protein [Deltaproteobacteria bacterium]|jgi:hypothetical protein|nr:autotransporter outer membrane beta-barrel domain-containing protein [Deltaproteobacteria bacterium]
MNGNALFASTGRAGILALGLIFLALFATLAASGSTASADEDTLSAIPNISEHITVTTEMGNVVAVKPDPSEPPKSHYHVLIFDASIAPNDSVAAGFTDTEDKVDNNTLEISQNAVTGTTYAAGGAIIGSGGGTPMAEENTVRVTGEYTGTGVLAGGLAVSGSGDRAAAVKNSVVFEAGSENIGDWDDIFGALIIGSGAVGGGENEDLGNRITIDGKGGEDSDAIILDGVRSLIGGKLSNAADGASVRNNLVEVKGEEGKSALIVSDIVAGGSITQGAATAENNLFIGNNRVKLEWGSYSNSAYEVAIAGGIAVETVGNVTLSSNVVELEGTVNVQGFVVGGYSEKQIGDEYAFNNSVNVKLSSTGLIDGDVFGAWLYVEHHYQAVAESNSVTIQSGTVSGNVTGAYDDTNNFYGKLNKVYVNTTCSGAGDVTITQNIYATNGIANAESNSVEIATGNHAVTVGGDIYGYSYAAVGTAENNSVTIVTGNSAVTVDGSIYGAWMRRPGGTAEGNSVFISTGAENFILGNSKQVFGAYIQQGGNVTGNSVKVELGSGDALFEGGDLFGAQAVLPNSPSSGDAKGNSVEIYCREQGCSSKATTGIIRGGIANGGDATGNWVTITASTNASNIYGGVTTGGVASGNRVTVAAEARISNAVGGESRNSDAYDNHVKLSGGVMISTVSYLQVTGGWAGGDAEGNTVEMDRVMLSAAATASGGYSEGGSAKNNSISITDSEIKGSIYGGETSYADGTAVSNTVTLNGTMIIDSSAAELAVGYAPSPVNAFSGNTLVLNHLDNTGAFGRIYGVERFEINVTAARAMEATDPAKRPLLPAEAVTFGDGLSGKSDIAIAISGSGRLNSGDTVYLVDESTGTVNANAADYIGSVTITQPFVSYAISVADIAATHGIEILEASVTDEAKALSELPLAVVSFVNRGSDLIAGQAIPAAVAAASPGLGVSAFANVSYGWHRAETGSHVEVKGTNGDVGVAFGTETSFGTLVAGAFLEFGDGSFDSYNDFANLASVHGEGDLSYLGGGAFLRFDAGPKDSSRPFAEASVRFGKADADFRTRDFSFSPGTEVSYGLDAKYWGFHAGLGYVFDFSDRGFDGTLEVSAKYFHVRREGDDFRVNDVPASLSAVTSSRAVAGARLNARFTPAIKGYFGLYFEHEFDGDSRVFYDGLPIPEVSLGGSSGIGELGLVVSSPGSPLEVRMGVQGSVGRRDGISASLSVMYTF